MSLFLDLAAYKIAKSKIDLSMLEEIPNINPVTIKAVVSFLAETDVHDADSEKQRFKKPFVQSNALTDKLAADARVLNSVNTAVVALEGKVGKQSINFCVKLIKIIEVRYLLWSILKNCIGGHKSVIGVLSGFTMPHPHRHLNQAFLWFKCQ